MKTTYEIILWVGSNCPDLSCESFDLNEAEQALKTFKENVEIAAEYLESNPDEGFPYMSIVKFREEGEDGFEYGDGDVFDADFSDLPKYVQKKCAELIAYDLSDK